ncbi:hypothetical protein L0657_00965 [Dyadobacter sp. CY345]|uniref:hypothetical protein n=1 Tax=Dyadobacter sp. CY345 TaxID=2909335 RepID=UPI001F1F21A4|nr:hypothetical protein [Dyadobacter sp. CY345]MCF2442507.1 hypothetical protein [Dyadobacter sp. CY345]
MDKKHIRLDDLKKETPFVVPDGYFENLPQIIQSRIPNEVVRESFIQWSWRRSAGLVAAMSFLLVMVWITFPERQGSLGQEPLSSISDASIVTYLEDQDISYYDLSEHQVVQKAFDTDSTVMYYLDGLDEDLIREQILESGSASEQI